MHHVGIDKDNLQVLEYLLNTGEAHLRLIAVAWLEVLLGLTSSAIEEV